MKSVMCSFHVYDLHGNHRYGMILGGDIWSKLKLDLFFSRNIRKLRGTYEVFTALMEEISKINFDLSSNWIEGE